MNYESKMTDDDFEILDEFLKIYNKSKSNEKESVKLDIETFLKECFSRKKECCAK
jgi:hypothetical protein